MIILGEDKLNLAALEDVARDRAKVQLGALAREGAAASALALQNLAASGKPIYGVNTGFGIFADRRIEENQSANLSRNLLLSHSVGVGPPLEPELVRAAMVIRANTLAQGFSGVRPELIELLLSMLNASVTPFIPSKGSLGASGDLAPLSHLALIFTRGEPETEDASGKAWFDGELLSGAEAMQRAGLARIQLGPKEGLALNNGASFSTAQLALSLLEIERTLTADELAQSLHYSEYQAPTYESAINSDSGSASHPMQTSVEADPERVSSAKPEATSTLNHRGEAYALRAVREMLGYVVEIVEREMNAATDNPLIFWNETLSGGNFHGQPLALAADCLKRALVEAGYIAHNRLTQSAKPHAGGGDPSAGDLIDSTHELSARLTQELRRWAQPDSILSLPTSADQEDLNPNAWNACRHLAEAAGLYRNIVAIGLLSAILEAPPDGWTSIGRDLVALDQLLSLPPSPGNLGRQIEILARAILDGEFD